MISALKCRSTKLRSTYRSQREQSYIERMNGLSPAFLTANISGLPTTKGTPNLVCFYPRTR
ncbi:unnamed protein product [Larinioides sclopetarius]|uniref:Uncharacterized protein n=1 Tax=Larinioides sclopetarius TaxID=280406 RepID=A0AAV2APJ8_9ARAC